MKIDNWFIGIVEAVNDPLEYNRCRVRCFHYHTQDKQLLPTDRLLWAPCILPTTEPNTNGVGTMHGLKEGSWVIGFFRDGSDQQDPMIFGSIPTSGQSVLDGNYIPSGGGTVPAAGRSYKKYESLGARMGTAIAALQPPLPMGEMQMTNGFAPGDPVQPLSGDPTGAAEVAAGLVGSKNPGYDGGLFLETVINGAMTFPDVGNEIGPPPVEVDNLTSHRKWAETNVFVYVQKNPNVIKKGDIIFFKGIPGVANSDPDSSGDYEAIVAFNTIEKITVNVTDTTEHWRFHTDPVPAKADLEGPTKVTLSGTIFWGGDNN